MTNEELAREAARKAAEYLDDYGCTNTHVPLVSSSIHPFILKAITSAVEAARAEERSEILRLAWEVLHACREVECCAEGRDIIEAIEARGKETA